jgi:hypothetical protein
MRRFVFRREPQARPFVVRLQAIARRRGADLLLAHPSGSPAVCSAPEGPHGVQRNVVAVDPGTTGTPAARASRFARALSPTSWIAAAGGQTHASPAPATAAAKEGFSDGKPGCTMRAPLAHAAPNSPPPSR